MFLKLIGAQLVLLEELHSQLSERVDGVHADVGARVASGLLEVLGQHAPDAVPHHADAAHIVIGDLHHFLQGEDAGGREVAAQFRLGHAAQRLDEVDDGLPVQVGAAREHAIDGRGVDEVHL